MARDGRDIEEQSTAKRAAILGLRYLDVRTLVRRPIYPDLIPKQQMYEHKLAPIVSASDRLTIGITAMTPPDILEELRRVYNQQRVRYVLISQTSLQEYYDLYYPPKKVVYQNVRLNADFAEESLKEIGQALENVTSDDMLAYFVHQAYRLQASDIHCENEARKVYIRMRVHGALYPVVELSKSRYKILVSAIASAAHLSTAANDSQTGHISQEHKMQDGTVVTMNFRVETIPAVDGMDIVLRFFAFDEEHLKLAQLNLTPHQQQIIEGIIKYPAGLVLVVGPTGSGKTTTLYSLLAELRSPQVKLITLEDPVEYQMTGITQIPIDVQQGASFAKGLRTVLRLDADVIMIGEIRDHDTAETALQAALTGHLVLSTYHAASTTIALVTLMQIAQRNPLFANAIRLIQSQRLIRRLDDRTKEAYIPDTAEREQINQILETFPQRSRPKIPPNFQLYRPVPSQENPSGFTDRMAIREFLIPDDEIRSFLLEQLEYLNPSQLEQRLCQSGKLTTMLQAGIMQVLAGVTSLTEIYKTKV